MFFHKWVDCQRFALCLEGCFLDSYHAPDQIMGLPRYEQLNQILIQRWLGWPREGEGWPRGYQGYPDGQRN